MDDKMREVEKGKIGIIIVNYNGENYQNDCIRTICNQTYKNYMIIVVDSGSTDQSIKKLKEEYGEKVDILERYENIGVAAGNNIGIHYALEQGCEYLLLLNNDVELDIEMLEKLMLSASENMVVVPKIYYFDQPNVLWMAGGEISWFKGEARHIGIDEEDKGQYDIERVISYAPTCAMLFHRTVIDKIGYEDEAMFMYWDDTDLCVRIVEAGYSIKYIPTAKMWHKVSSSSGGAKSKTFIYYYHRNQIYFLVKHRKKCKCINYMYARLKAWVKYFLSTIRNKNDKYIKIAFADYKRGIMGRKDF